ncbi:MAG: YegP family protein [Micromonosporaceae bacterium]
MAGKFELYTDKAGKYRFRLKAGNGQIIAVGEAYESKSSAMNGIDSVKRNAPAAALDDQTD